ncbi:hypothetical protein EG329_013258 [Mollisiaceae sp. DMI_Dod_QoI]|nr:hypothetical protein EG329_013258 [Helotiales sp. DMI_Dod_QoI]
MSSLQKLLTSSGYNCSLNWLDAEQARAKDELTTLKTSIDHDIRLALSEESSCDSIEDFLATKHNDRLTAIQLSRLEKERKQVEEWDEIENVLEIERERFRSELLMDECLPLTVPLPIMGMEWQIADVQTIAKLIEKFGEKKKDEQGPVARPAAKRRIMATVKVKMQAEGQERRRKKSFSDLFFASIKRVRRSSSYNRTKMHLYENTIDS